MRAYTISKVGFATVFLAAFSFVGPGLAARQAATSSAAAKPTTPKKSVVKRPAKKRKPRQRAQTAPTPARISEIQSALAAQGAYKGQPNGKWDSATIQAMKDYQSSAWSHCHRQTRRPDLAEARPGLRNCGPCRAFASAPNAGRHPFRASRSKLPEIVAQAGFSFQLAFASV